MPKNITNGTWLKQFNKSLMNWSTTVDDRKYEIDPNDLMGSLDKIVNGYFECKNEEDEITLLASKVLVHQSIDRVFTDVENITTKCESPIERAMVLALTIISNNLAESTGYEIDNVKYELVSKGLENICIKPQAQLGDYRVDFLLECEITAPDFVHKQKLSNGSEMLGYRTVTKMLIIECDGHDFHEKTKEQAAKDKARDRALQSLGYLVYRYTGSELWKDVFKCAHQAVIDLLKITEKEAWGK